MSSSTVSTQPPRNPSRRLPNLQEAVLKCPADGNDQALIAVKGVLHVTVFIVQLIAMTKSDRSHGVVHVTVLIVRLITMTKL